MKAKASNAPLRPQSLTCVGFSCERMVNASAHLPIISCESSERGEFREGRVVGKYVIPFHFQCLVVVLVSNAIVRRDLRIIMIL